MSVKATLQLNGRRALVTGSGQGIGRAIAAALAEFGADVMVHCAGNLAKAEAVRRKIEACGVKSGVVAADLAAPGAAEQILQATRAAIGDPDILVLNASVQIRKPWQQITAEDFRQQVEVNFGSCLWLIQRCAPAMQTNKWGRILTLGSVQQVKPHPEMQVYSATKSALVNLCRSLAPQLAKDGITINNLAPGAIATGRNEKALADEPYLAKVLEKIPAGYIGEPQDCAGLAVLLCSEAGRYITGADFLVDGGMSL
ncbi:MAG: SDR family oxidoreductase [Verrucomicrobiota bacterium]